MNSDSSKWDNQHMLYIRTVGKNNGMTPFDRLLYKNQTNWGKIPCETIENTLQPLELGFLPCGTPCPEWAECDIWVGNTEGHQRGNLFHLASFSTGLFPKCIPSSFSLCCLMGIFDAALQTLMVSSIQSLLWALGSPRERRNTSNPTDFILNHCCHIFTSAKWRFAPGKEKKSSSLWKPTEPNDLQRADMTEQHGCFCLVFIWMLSCSPLAVPHLPGLSGGTVPWEDTDSLTASSAIARQPQITGMQSRRMFLMCIWPTLITLQNSPTRRGIFFL